MSMLWASVSGGPPILVPADRVTNCEAQTHQQTAADFATIGSPMDWARRCGEEAEDDPEIWGDVSEMLILGTRRSVHNSDALSGFQQICPTATVATWWIFKHSENIGHAKLYKKLFKCCQARPSTTDILQLEDFARRSLEHVAKDLSLDAGSIMNSFYKGKDAGQRPAAVQGKDTAARGENKSQGNGGQSSGWWA